MYKSNFLSQIVRSGRAQPFFSQNVANANTTALHLIKPNLGLVADRPYFSSWSQSGPNASNTSNVYGTQSTYAIVSANDDNAWDHQHIVPKANLIARRASTGVKTPISRSVVDKGEELLYVSDHDDGISQPESWEILQLETDLQRLLAQGSYKEALKVYESSPFDDNAACQLSYLTALNQLDSKKVLLSSSSHHIIPRLISFFKYIETNNIALGSTNTNLVLRIFLRHRTDVQKTQSVLEGALNDGDSSANISALRQAHKQSVDEAASTHALQVYRSKASHTHIDNDILEQLIHACRLDGAHHESLAIYNQLRSQTSEISVYTFSTLVELFSDIKDSNAMVECYNEWKSLSTASPSERHHMYMTLFASFLKAEDVYMASRFVNDVLASDLEFQRLFGFQIVLQLLEVDARSIADHIKASFPAVINAEAFQIALTIAACTRNEDRTAWKNFGLIQNLTRFNEHPDVLDNYLAMLIKHGYLDEASRSLARLHEAGVRPSNQIVVNMIDNTLSAGQAQAALNIFCAHVAFLRTQIEPAQPLEFATVALRMISQRHCLSTKNLIFLLEELQALDLPIPDTTLAAMLSSLQRRLDNVQLTSIALLELQHLKNALQSCGPDKDLQESMRWIFALAPGDYHSEGTNNVIATQTQDHCALIVLEPLPDRVTAHTLGQDDHPQLRCIVNSHRSLPSDSKQIVEIVRQFDAASIFNNSDMILRAINILGDKQSRDYIRMIGMSLEVQLQPVSYDQSVRLLLGRFYDGLIIASNDCHDNVLATSYLEKLYALGYCPAAATYASFVAKMESNLFQDCASRALEVLNEAKRHAVMPNEFLMNTVIAKLAKARRNEEAIGLFYEMKRVGLTPNEVTYGTMINSCCRVGRGADAETLLAELESQSPGLQSRVAPYNTLIQYYVQNVGDREKALHFWNRLRQTAITPTSHTYRLLIEAYGHLTPADPFAAESVMGEMRARNLAVEGVHHAALLHMYGITLSDLPRAKQHFEFLISHVICNYEDALPVYQSILQVVLHHRDSDTLQAILERMQLNGFHPNAYITNLAIKGLAQTGDIAQAREMFDALPAGAGAFGREPSTYTAMIEAYQSNAMPTRAAQIYALLEQQRFPPATLRKAQNAMLKTAMIS